MKLCTIDGCERPLRARGWCATHWARWRKHGDSLFTMMPNRGQGKDPVAHREAQARYRERHREALRAQGRTYSAAHRAESNARRMASKAANPAKHTAANQRYYREHREAVLARIEVWRLQNPERKRGYLRQRRARLRGDAGQITAAEWQAVLAAYHHCCAYCGASGPLEQDHVIPVARGGRHTMHNVVPACRSCNATKGRYAPLKSVALVLL
jgi:5-methylcytosine-specific restriction endonuclease McrA